MDSVLFTSFLFFTVSSFVTPGPNNIMMMGSGANFGFRRTVPHMLGVALGFPLMVLLAGLGLGTVLQAYPIIHTILRYVGAAYMLWMAWKIGTTTHLDKNETRPATPMTFLQAVLFQWVNPKAWTMATSAIAAYTTPAGSYYGELLLIVFIFILVGVPNAALWTAGGKLTASLLNSPRRFRIFNISMAALLALSVIPILFH